MQNPSDATEAEMPLSALAASNIDYRAAAADLGPLLSKLLAEEAGPDTKASPPPDIVLEVDIARGRSTGTETITAIGHPVALSCPSCGGVLSQINQGSPLRFRCQVGHGFTADALYREQEGAVDKAIRVALRIIEERIVLTQKLAEDAQRNGWSRAITQWDARVAEHRSYAATLRQAAIKTRP